MSVETEEKQDLVDSFQREWDESHPEMHYQCVPAVTRMVRMSEYIARNVDATLTQFGLTRGEAEVLFALVRNPSRAITPKVLQTLMLISSGGLTRRLDNLEQKGLICRYPDPNDRRGTLLQPTQKGRELTLKAHAAHIATEAKLVEVLSPADLSQLETLLKKLILAQQKKLFPNGLS